MTLRGSELYMSPIVYDNYKLRRINNRDIKPQNILIFPGNIYKLS